MNNAVENEVKENVVEEVKYQIDDVVYGWDNYEYERTYELRESTVGQVNPIPMGVELEVFNDTSQMTTRTDGNWQKWHAHASVVDQSDQRENIPLWIIGGTSSYIYSHIPRDYISSTKRTLKMSKQHINALRKGLKRQGIDSI